MKDNTEEVELESLRQKVSQLEKSLKEFEKLKKTSQQKEEALKESEEKYRTIFENTGTPIIFIEEDSTVSMVNREFENTTGFTKEEVEWKKSFLEFVANHEEKKKMMEYHHLRRIDPEAVPESYEFQFLDKEGNVKNALVRVSMVSGTGKSLAALMDITEHKKSEYALQESMNRFSQVVENAEEWVWEVNTDGLYTYSSPNVKKILGYQPEEIVGQKYFYDFFPPEDREYMKKKAFKIFKKRESFHSFVNFNIHKNGEEVILETSGVPFFDENNNLKGYRGVDNDITERKATLEKLHRSEERFRALAESAVDAILTTDKNGKIILFNRSMLKIFGYSKQEILHKPVTLLIPDRLKENFQRRLVKFRTTGKHSLSGKIFQSTGLRKDGTEFPFEMSLATWEAEGEKYNTSIIRDITERKKAEKSLQESQNKLKIAMDLAKLVHWEYDVKADLFHFDDQFYSLYGTTTDQVGGAEMSSEEYSKRFVDPDWADVVAVETKKAIITDDPDFRGYVEHPIIRADGEKRYIVVRFGVIKDENGQTIRTYGANQDITERVEAEKSIKDQAELLNLASEAIFVHDLDNKILFWNDGAAKMYGWSRKEAIGKTTHDLLQTEFEESLEDIIAHVMDEGYWNGELVHFTRDGAEVIVDSSWTLKRDEDGHPLSILRINTDITERVKAEENLRMSEIKYHTLYSSMSEGVAIHKVIYDDNQIPADYEIVDVNPAFEKILGLDRKEFLGKKASEAYGTGEAPYLDIYSEVAKTGNSTQFETYFKSSDTYFSISVFSPYPGFFATVFEDISERKKAEDDIKASLKQKELLLQEIHHRVKNNLQIISSLLNLQESYVDDEEAIDVLQESQNRVLSMAMIHEMLYDSEDLSTINFHGYIQNLVYDLFNSYGVKGNILELNLNVDEIYLNIETAVPCGLIISELVSNCLKYAFPGDESGNLSIDFHLQNYDEFELIIADDGVGLSGNIDFENTDSLGLRLVSSLVNQLDGSIELDRSQGTKFIIKFKELEYRKRI